LLFPSTLFNLANNPSMTLLPALANKFLSLEFSAAFQSAIALPVFQMDLVMLLHVSKLPLESSANTPPELVTMESLAPKTLAMLRLEDVSTPSKPDAALIRTAAMLWDTSKQFPKNARSMCTTLQQRPATSNKLETTRLANASRIASQPVLVTTPPVFRLPTDMLANTSKLVTTESHALPTRATAPLDNVLTASSTDASALTRLVVTLSQLPLNLTCNVQPSSTTLSPETVMLNQLHLDRTALLLPLHANSSIVSHTEFVIPLNVLLEPMDLSANVLL
jgi:hypothetical protein